MHLPLLAPTPLTILHKYLQVIIIAVPHTHTTQRPKTHAYNLQCPNGQDKTNSSANLSSPVFYSSNNIWLRWFGSVRTQEIRFPLIYLVKIITIMAFYVHPKSTQRRIFARKSDLALADCMVNYCPFDDRVWTKKKWAAKTRTLAHAQPWAQYLCSAPTSPPTECLTADLPLQESCSLNLYQKHLQVSHRSESLS